MQADPFRIADDFPPVGYEQWRALAEAELQGVSIAKGLTRRTSDGIDMHPLHTRSFPDGIESASAREGIPGQPPFVRGAECADSVLTGFDLRQEHGDPDPDATRRAIADDLAGGATSISLRMANPTQRGVDARGGLVPSAPRPSAAPGGTRGTGPERIAIESVEDLDYILSGAATSGFGIAVNGGAAFLPAAAILVAYWRRRGVSLEQAHGSFGADPLAELAQEGQVPYSIETALRLIGDLAVWTSAEYPRVRSVAVDTSVYHHGGATAAQDIALGLATGVAYLRSMIAAGMPIDDAARQIEFRVALGTHHFQSIAKLRALRRLWWAVVEACGGGSAAGGIHLHARVSLRVLTRIDPHVNLLRNTASLFAAILGGAQVVTSTPFDAMLGRPTDFSRRIARNTALILKEEGHLHRVIDPAGGSWFLVDLTRQLASKAWALFQEIERQGGMVTALLNGWVGRQVDEAHARRALDIARRKEGITGVSEFPDIHEQPFTTSAPSVEPLAGGWPRSAAPLDSAALTQRLADLATTTSATSAAVDAAIHGASLAQMAAALRFHEESTDVVPFPLRSFAEPFEELRDASDAWLAGHGRRPRVFLATLGPAAHFTARATYAKNFFEAGGFEVVGGNTHATVDEVADAMAASGASIAVICSSDRLYPELIPQAAPRLKTSGARTIIVAGNPGAMEETWRTAGVDRFIFIKCDLLAILRDLLREEGVLR